MSRRVFRIAALVVCTLTLSACEVDPYCFDCVDHPLDAGRVDSGDVGPRDASDTGPHDANVTDTNIVDAWVMPDGCAIGATELCNHFDDDCDGMIDEGVDTTHDVANCGSCGNHCTYAHAFGSCTASTCSMGDCQAGYIDVDHMSSDGCEYHCIATGAETCDLRDNDCDGTIDEGFVFATDPNNCGLCGRVCNLAHSTSSCTGGMCSIGACMPGFVDIDGVAANGCEYACTPSGAEVCDRIDNNCDGHIDEGDPGGGTACGSAVGICRQGVQHCVGGALTCSGGTSPGVETCNNMDDDCDGTVDDGNPGGGPACGNSIGACTPGRLTCTAGSLMCQGGTAATPETCNGVDDDCNGVVDNGNPGGGAACGMTRGRCRAGTTMCAGGTLACMGQIGPVLETCNMIDDDCNGVVDDGFDTLHDVRNCGGCGHVCSFPNAVSMCAPTIVGGVMVGTCQVAGCLTGYTNLDGSLTNPNGCEYMCTRTSSTETCNGRDDNCNGTVDEGVTPPAGLCLSNGICAGTTPVCRGATGFTCTYPAADATGRHGYEVTEVTCDGTDNDCDGGVDEPFPTLNQSCNNGAVGQCFHTGTVICGTTAPYRTTMCNAVAGVVMTESCNGVDDDCNGTIDDGITARGTWTRIRPAGAPAAGTSDYWIQTYEASRPDATATTVGLSAARACSMPSRVPWTTITAPAAATACAAVGGTLCTEAQWQRACESQAATACNWSESTTCNAYTATTCNGIDYDSDSTMTGNQDSLIATGAATSCYTPWSFTYTSGAATVTAAGNVFDMSGNAEEWTAARATNTYAERGGSYNDIQGGMTCQFNFEVADNTIALPNVGFRCCRATDPALP